MASFLLHFLRFYHLAVSWIESLVRSTRHVVSQGASYGSGSALWHVYADHSHTAHHSHSIGPIWNAWVYCRTTARLYDSPLQTGTLSRRLPWLSAELAIDGGKVYSLDSFLSRLYVVRHDNGSGLSHRPSLSLGHLVNTWCIDEGRWFPRAVGWHLRVIDHLAEEHNYTHEHVLSTFETTAEGGFLSHLSHEKN